MKTLMPIQTEWKGYRFRSRLEARWAVFFEALGLLWRYEPEGFHLPHGSYLPDFLIAESVWVEVKPDIPPPLAWDLACDLAKASGHNVIMAWGDPMNGRAILYDPDGCLWTHIVFAECRRCPNEIWWMCKEHDGGILAAGQIQPCGKCQSERYPIISGLIRNAALIARQARFEHGDEPL